MTTTLNPPAEPPSAAPTELPTSAYEYDLPPDRIAAFPTAERDASRLLVVRRDSDVFEDRTFRDLPDLILPGDVLVLNETRVFPARLLGTRAGGGAAEIVLLREHGRGPGMGALSTDWQALVRPGARLRAGRRVSIADDLEVEILDVLPDGNRVVRLHTSMAIHAALQEYGRLPLPPYIERDVAPSDTDRYQTVFGTRDGSVAAPTAGLHFTPALLGALEARGVEVVRVLLHVGVGTFRPVEVEDPTHHEMHEEWYEVTSHAAERINSARANGHRVWAVGTTVARTLESAATADGRLQAGAGWTRLFIRPGYTFRMVDRLVTNFHLPRSTLLMLVSALAGHARTMSAYEHAVRSGYRFYSYGDAMVVL